MSVAVVSGNVPKTKNQRGRKGAGGWHGAVFFHLCLPRANFWLMGKLGLCWTDNHQQRKMTAITLSSQVPQPGQGVGGLASSLTWPSK